LVELGVVPCVDFLLGKIDFDLNLNISIKLDANELMHRQPHVQRLRQLKQEHHVIPVNSRELEHLVDVFVHDLVIMGLAMKFSVI
jgi:hypothetical protein